MIPSLFCLNGIMFFCRLSIKCYINVVKFHELRAQYCLGLNGFSTTFRSVRALAFDKLR